MCASRAFLKESRSFLSFFSIGMSSIWMSEWLLLETTVPHWKLLQVGFCKFVIGLMNLMMTGIGQSKHRNSVFLRSLIIPCSSLFVNYNAKYLKLE